MYNTHTDIWVVSSLLTDHIPLYASLYIRFEEKG